jgi:hypothetical protein
MGSSNEKPAPTFNNRCYKNDGDYHSDIYIDGTCDLAGQTTSCFKGGEWGHSGDPHQCYYVSIDRGREMDGGYCDCCAHCGITGSKSGCRRERSNGSAPGKIIGMTGGFDTTATGAPTPGQITCCTNQHDDLAQYNSEGYSEDSRCFTDAGHNNECSSLYRSFGTSQCEAVMNYDCANNLFTSGTTVDVKKWDPVTHNGQTSYCDKYLKWHLNRFGTSVTGTAAQQDSFKAIQGLVQTMIANYKKDHKFPAEANDAQYTKIQDVIHYICDQMPGACDTSLTAVCTTVTRSSLADHPQNASFCGCFMAPSEYNIYNQYIPSDAKCDPLCARENVIKLGKKAASGSQGQPDLCNSNICIIDNLSIQLAQSSVGGKGVTINQICGGCSSAQNGSSNTVVGSSSLSVSNTSSCQCYFQNVNISSVSSSIGGGVAVSQLCGNSPSCASSDPANPGKSVPVNCAAVGVIDPFEQQQITQKNQATIANNAKTLQLILIVVVGLLIIFVFLFLIFRGSKNYQTFSSSNKARGPKMIGEEEQQSEGSQISTYRLGDQSVNNILSSSLADQERAIYIQTGGSNANRFFPGL